MIFGLLLVVLAECSSAQSSTSRIGEARYQEVAASLTERHVVPRYESLAASALKFHEIVGPMCGAAPPRRLERTRMQFHNLFDRWAAVAHVQHGPVELLMRSFRIQFWPDKRGRAGRQIAELIRSRNIAALKPEHFARESVAIQGLTAAERLLFEEKYANALSSGSADDFPRKLLVAISNNLAEMSRALAADWSQGQGTFLSELRSPGSEHSRFASNREVVAAFVRGFYMSLQMMTDLKLDKLLGKTIDFSRPKRTESWRSGRSLRNIVANLSALQAMYEGSGGFGLRALLGSEQAVLEEHISKAFMKSLAKAQIIEFTLVQAVVDPLGREQVLSLARELRALKALVRNRFAPAIGAPLGFNALDGD